MSEATAETLVLLDNPYFSASRIAAKVEQQTGETLSQLVKTSDGDFTFFHEKEEDDPKKTAYFGIKTATQNPSAFWTLHFSTPFNLGRKDEPDKPKRRYAFISLHYEDPRENYDSSKAYILTPKEVEKKLTFKGDERERLDRCRLKGIKPEVTIPPTRHDSGLLEAVVPTTPEDSELISQVLERIDEGLDRRLENFLVTSN